MPTKKISDLTNVASAQDSDLLVIETSEGTRSVSKEGLFSDIIKESPSGGIALALQNEGWPGNTWLWHNNSETANYGTILGDYNATHNTELILFNGTAKLVNTYASEETSDSVNLMTSNTISGLSYYDITLQNVEVTTASSNGAYYGTCAVLSEVMPDDYKNVVSLLNMGWTGASASFSLYVQDQIIKIMSDVSQTIANLNIRILYIQQ